MPEPGNARARPYLLCGTMEGSALLFSSHAQRKAGSPGAWAGSGACPAPGTGTVTRRGGRSGTDPSRVLLQQGALSRCFSMWILGAGNVPCRAQLQLGRAQQNLMFLGAFFRDLGSQISAIPCWVLPAAFPQVCGSILGIWLGKHIFRCRICVFSQKKLVLGAGQSWHSPGNRHRSPGPPGLQAQPRIPPSNPFVFPEPPRDEQHIPDFWD